MAKKKTIDVQGTSIKLLTNKENDYISLTDIDTKFDGKGRHIENWFRNQNTIEYLAVWEELNNPDFNSMQLHGIKEQVGLNRFLMSAKKWTTLTNAIGITAKSGRYGGTYAHPDIAFHFCLWLSPTFQLYISKEFQRLKIKEAQEEKEALDWNLKRTLAKVNYRIHTDAIKANLIPARISNNPKQSGFVYASEADLLNVALFGMTAKEWRIANPKQKGNIRDHATGEQLLVLANLESHNAEFIKDNLSQDERVHKLNEIAIYQMQVLVNVPTPMLKGLTDEKSNQL
jgi:hypothetical protein